MNELDELNELGFYSINDIINSNGFKEYIQKIFENKNKIDNTSLNNFFKYGIATNKIHYVYVDSKIAISYFSILENYIELLLKRKKLQKILDNIKK